ncbi:hypothetical protein B5181_11305 [Streptomyces sp. 4F]|nr:hypothetical protein B5181_11305 [Streptomyces sp. 4F]
MTSTITQDQPLQPPKGTTPDDAPQQAGVREEELMTLFEIGHPLLSGDPTPARDSPVWNELTSVGQGAGLFLGR